MTEHELALRHAIMRHFAATGEAPVLDDAATLRSLAEQHVAVLARDGSIAMAHPFAGHRAGTRVKAGARTWWGNCAWDGLGIAAALGLSEATVTSNGIELRLRGGPVRDDALFHVAVPAHHWWDDIAHT